jgi:hypothetical protein
MCSYIIIYHVLFKYVDDFYRCVFWHVNAITLQEILGWPFNIPLFQGAVQTVAGQPNAYWKTSGNITRQRQSFGNMFELVWTCLSLFEMIWDTLRCFGQVWEQQDHATSTFTWCNLMISYGSDDNRIHCEQIKPDAGMQAESIWERSRGRQCWYV